MDEYDDIDQNLTCFLTFCEQVRGANPQFEFSSQELSHAFTGYLAKRNLQEG